MAHRKLSEQTPLYTQSSFHTTIHTNDRHGHPIIDPRKAYQCGDVQASRATHAWREINGEMFQRPPENHAGQLALYVKPMVYGGLDGIITSFATVMSVAGAKFNSAVIIVIGVAHLFADGLSMAMGDYLSSKAERELNNTERKREKWEMENNLQGEINEMIAIYCGKGMKREDAEAIIHTLVRYPDIFLDLMMVEELALMPPDENNEPWRSALVTFGSFVVFGIIPLLPYLVISILGIDGDYSAASQLWSSVVLTGLTLFILGAVKGMLVEQNSNWIKGGFQIFFNGAAAAFIGYTIGFWLSKIVPDANLLDT